MYVASKCEEYYPAELKKLVQAEERWCVVGKINALANVRLYVGVGATCMWMG